jgi:putative Mn2+ efflux pump MntP
VGLSLAAYKIDLLWFLAVAAVMNIIFLITGQKIGTLAGEIVSENRLKLIASVMIILLGMSKLF